MALLATIDYLIVIMCLAIIDSNGTSCSTISITVNGKDYFLFTFTWFSFLQSSPPDSVEKGSPNNDPWFKLS